MVFPLKGLKRAIERPDKYTKGVCQRCKNTDKVDHCLELWLDSIDEPSRPGAGEYRINLQLHTANSDNMFVCKSCLLKVLASVIERL